MPLHAIRLAPQDNVAVLVDRVPAGGEVLVEGLTVVVDRDIGLGHKIALQRISPGERILKHGVSIGSATREIAVGAHVHVHNMRSDYLPTHTLDGGRGSGGGS